MKLIPGHPFLQPQIQVALSEAEVGTKNTAIIPSWHMHSLKQSSRLLWSRGQNQLSDKSSMHNFDGGSKNDNPIYFCSNLSNIFPIGKVS